MNDRMKAMVLEQPGEPLRLVELPVPEPTDDQVLIQVDACGVCRTDLHIIDGELTEPKLPLVPGHEIVGRVVRAGKNALRWNVGDRVGVPWLGYTCGRCRYCLSGRENLCDNPGFTGYTIDGGFAEYTVADARYIFPIPETHGDVEAAPLLCAGLIGYRSYSMIGEPVDRLGIYGFGAAAHLVAQVAVHEGAELFAFTRPGDNEAQSFARRLGAVWAGGSDQSPPKELDAAVIFAPVGSLVPAALRNVRKGGSVICGGIHMSDIPSFPYAVLWGERSLRSVANLTRNDAEQFMKIAAEVPVRTETSSYPLEEAGRALEDLREGRLQGAAVLAISGTAASG